MCRTVNREQNGLLGGHSVDLLQRRTRNFKNGSKCQKTQTRVIAAEATKRRLFTANLRKILVQFLEPRGPLNHLPGSPGRENALKNALGPEAREAAREGRREGGGGLPAFSNKCPRAAAAAAAFKMKEKQSRDAGEGRERQRERHHTEFSRRAKKKVSSRTKQRLL